MRIVCRAEYAMLCRNVRNIGDRISPSCFSDRDILNFCSNTARRRVIGECLGTYLCRLTPLSQADAADGHRDHSAGFNTTASPVESKEASHLYPA